MTDTFHDVRAAILAATPQAETFPYGAGEALTPERLAALRAAPHLQDVLAEMRAEAHRAQTEPIPTLPFSAFYRFEAEGTRREYEAPYFARRGRLLGLVLTAVVDETDEPLPALADLLWAICDEYTWAVPATIPVGVAANVASHREPWEVVDLFAAETAHALAETLYLLGGRLNPWLHYRVRAEIERRVFRPLFHDPVHFGWESVTNNWAAVCAGSVGMAALLLERDRERLAGMTDRVLRAMGSFLSGFGADGGCAEGIGYWIYGFGYFTYFAEMLRAYTGGALDLLHGDKVRQIAGFPAAADLSDNRYVPFSDSFADRLGRTAVPTGLLCRLAARTGQPTPRMTQVPSFHFDACYRWGHVTRNLLWSDPARFNQPLPDQTTYFPDLAWTVARRLLGARDAAESLSFAAKGGHNGESHNHNDLGHFVLHIGGESLLADLGAGVYTRQYFREERYRHLHPSSEGHSVPVIAGHGQAPGREHAARVLAHQEGADGATLALDLTPAYAVPSLQRCHRIFTWTVDTAARTARLDLADEFAFASPPASLAEVFISLRPPAIADGLITWQGDHGAVTLHYGAGEWRPCVDAIPTHDHASRPQTVYRLSLERHTPGTTETARFTFTCELQPAGERQQEGAAVS
ncbi:MAG TPA: heparinase II/III family protein [Thermomicrobiales bacterium]|nr:heparinase II/III family protein [Thermomicrobiales bacterium]